MKSIVESDGTVVVIIPCCYLIIAISNIMVTFRMSISDSQEVEMKYTMWKLCT